MAIAPTDAASIEVSLDADVVDALTFDAETGAGVPPCELPARETTTCDDGDPCTQDDRCVARLCVGDPRDCSDGDPCSIDVCDPIVGCVNTVLPDTSCDDGNVCTAADACEGGLCRGSPLGRGDLCDDGDPCTTASTCEGGACGGGSALTCPASSVPCRLAVCQSGVGCTTVAAPDDLPCSDATTCTGPGRCQLGVCAAVALADGNTCGLATPCRAPPMCVGGSCQPGLLLDAGTSCESPDACAATAACDAVGTCFPTSWVDCDDGNSCTTDGCSASAGCLHAPQSEGSPCDGACGLVGTCHGGACDGPPPCDAFGGPCEVWECGDGGGCIPVGPRPDGSPCGTICAPAECLAGSCGDPDLVDCFDGDVCVERKCVPTIGCATVGNRSAFCNADDDACTLLDRCQQGSCTAAAGCDDLEPCTMDACDSGRCVHTWAAGDGCDTEDQCDDGLDDDDDGRLDCLDRRCERSDPVCLATAGAGGVIELDAAGMGTLLSPGLPVFTRSGGTLALSGEWTASPADETRVDATLCCFELPPGTADLWLVFREVSTFPAYGDGCPGTTDHLVTRRVSVESTYTGTEDFPLYTLYQGGLPLSDTPCGVPTWRILKLSALAIGAVPLTRVRLRFQASFLGTPFPGGAWTVNDLALVGPETCDNGVDDNGDARVDCADPLCFGACTDPP